MMLNLLFEDIPSQSSKILMNFESNNLLIKNLRLNTMLKMNFAQKLQLILLMTALFVLFSKFLYNFSCVLSLVSLISYKPYGTRLCGRKLFQKSEVWKFLMPQLFILLVVNESLRSLAIIHFD